jgi:hypothetical protein
MGLNSGLSLVTASPQLSLGALIPGLEIAAAPPPLALTTLGASGGSSSGGGSSGGGSSGGSSGGGASLAVLALTLAVEALQPANGAVAIDASQGNSFVVDLTSDAALSFINWPAARSQRVVVYFVQDATGARVVSWPACKWSDGQPATLSTAPGAIDAVVFDFEPNLQTLFASQVGANYT